MAFCRLCQLHTKIPNKEVKADSLLTSFVMCLGCKNSGVKSELNSVETRTIEANDTIEIANAIRNDLIQAKSAKKLKILVWGPNPESDDPLAKKRNELRDKLNAMGHSAVFSEDLPSIGLPANVAEAIQTDYFNLVVCIASSYGSIGEVHELFIGLGRRGLVWFDEAARNGFAGNGIARTLMASGTKVEYYDNDYVNCCILVKGSIYFVESIVANDIMADHYEKRSKRMRII